MMRRYPGELGFRESRRAIESVYQLAQDTRERLNCPTLTRLTLNKFVWGLLDLNTVALCAKGSNVSKLDISQSKCVMGEWSAFFSHGFPSLETLILNDCGLNSDDLSSLTQAGVEGRLPELKHLDLSDNEATIGQWRHLFSHGQKWSHLLSMNIKQNITEDSRDNYTYLVDQVRLGALANLQQFSFLSHGNDCLQNCLSVKWPSIQKLDITSTFRHNSTEHVQVFQEILNTVENVSLPQLRTVSVTSKLHSKYINPSTIVDSLQYPTESYNVQKRVADLAYASSPLLTTCLSPETNEFYGNYLHGLKDNVLAMRWPLAEQFVGYSNTIRLRMTSHGFSPNGPDFH